MKGALNMALTEAQSYSCITSSAPNGSAVDWYPRAIKLVDQILVPGVSGHWCNIFGKYDAFSKHVANTMWSFNLKFEFNSHNNSMR